LLNIFEGWSVSLAKKLCDFDADPDHDLDPGFFYTEYSTLRETGNCMNFAGSAALAEVCNHRVLVVVAAFVLEI